MKKLNLPKQDKSGVPYISYSQKTTWCKNKRDYIRQYFFGETFTGNDYTDFGSKVGEALENNDFSGFTIKEQRFLATIPRYDQFEREIKLQMDGFYVKGFIDTNTLEIKEGKDDVKSLMDYKTGDIKTKIAEYDTDDYHQLEIYAGAIEQETGVLPTDCKVCLIDRTGNAFKGEKLKLGNEFVIIEKQITKERVNQVLSEVQETAEEIASYYEVFLKLKEA